MSDKTEVVRLATLNLGEYVDVEPAGERVADMYGGAIVLCVEDDKGSAAVELDGDDVHALIDTLAGAVSRSEMDYEQRRETQDG